MRIGFLHYTDILRNADLPAHQPADMGLHVPAIGGHGVMVHIIHLPLGFGVVVTHLGVGGRHADLGGLFELTLDFPRRQLQISGHQIIQANQALSPFSLYR